MSRSLRGRPPNGSSSESNRMAKRPPSQRIRGPKIVTVPPGPKSKAAAARKSKFVTNGVRIGLPIDVTWAEGSLVRDADRNVYVVLGGGICLQTVGERPPAVIRSSKAHLVLL